MAKHPFYKEDIVALALKTKLRPLTQQITKVNIGGTNNPEFIVIHFVGAAGQAKANADYFQYVYREASAHIFEDKNSSYQVVPDNRVAWHIGDGAYEGRGGSANGYKIKGMATNTNSIGIEGCQDTSTGSNVWAWQFHVNTYVMMLLRTIDLQKKYGIPDNKVIRHFDASQKSCPGNWMVNDWARWKQFKKDLADIKKAMATGGVVDVTPTPVPVPETNDGKQPLTNMYTIQTGDTLGKIAREHKVTVQQLAEWNNIKNVNLIFPETKIFVKSPDQAKPVTPVSTITQNGKAVPKTGGFIFSEEVNIRNQAGAWGPIPDRYYPGEKLNKYDSVTLAGGHIWLGYKSYDGKQRYISAGTPNVAYGKFV